MNYIELKNKLIYLNDQYHNKNISEITDKEYDQLLIQLRDMERLQGFADIDSPTQTIGSKITHGRKIKHSEKMYSLNNVFSDEELENFFKEHRNEEFVCEPKVDGMSGSLIYTNGKLTLGISRGDGLVGENITENIMMVNNIPKEIKLNNKFPYPIKDFEIRGEFVISNKDFDVINKIRQAKGLEPFTTARNLVAGTMRSLDQNDVKERCVRFYAYGSPSWKDLDYLVKRKIIVDMGFSYVDIYTMDGIDKAVNISKQVYENSDKLDYGIDGVVIKLTSAKLQEELGHTSKDPKWAVARKWNSDSIPARVIGIEHQVGRTGVITPVIKIEPVIINGVTVSSATAHNYEEIERLNIGNNALIGIIRSGDVIPKIEKVIYEKNVKIEKFTEPKECPVCQHAIIAVGAKHYCSNRYCFGKRLAYINYFVSRDVMNINDISEATVKQLVYKGFVSSPEDLYKLTKYNILALEGFAEKSANKLLENIEKSKQPTLEKFIVSLGILNVGINTAKALARRFNNIQNIQKATIDDLIVIDDIGIKTAEEIVKYFNEETNIHFINELLKYVTPLYVKENISDELKGKVFVITGSFPNDRKEIQAMIEKHSGKVSGTVSNKTTLVIVGENPGNNKIQDAIKYDIKMLDMSNKQLSEILETLTKK